MDQDDSVIRLGLVQVPHETESESEKNLLEELELFEAKHILNVQPAGRRSFEEDFEEIKALARLTDYDPVTRLLNRRAAWKKYLEAIGRARRNDTGIIFADVDDFKLVNKLHTRPGGDLVLGAIGKILDQARRAHDIVIGRLGDGADEFMAIISEFEQIRDFEKIVYRFAEALNNKDVQRAAGYTFDQPLRISVGCAIFSWPSIKEDRRPYAEELGKKIYKLLSQATDRAKHERKEMSAAGNGDELRIPMLRITLRKTETLVTAQQYLRKPLKEETV
ncbi:MAG: diguanylate cyclase [Candidatus Doudnabacteria bacterium]|nr:diguanylate cyclase [Candidatus Doudnabacteria bacterium]